MHINIHVASGIILATLYQYFFPCNFWIFAFIVGCAFIADFDFIFTKYARDQNHRNLFTHSIYLSLILVLLGLAFNNFWIIMGGIAYFSHILLDLFDWGTNLFYSNKIYGWAILIQKDEQKNFQKIVLQQQNRQFFFIKRYYSNSLIRVLEISFALLMFLLLVSLAITYWYFLILYIGSFFFHLGSYLFLAHKIDPESNIPITKNNLIL